MQPLFGRKNPCKCDRKYGFKELYIYAIIGTRNTMTYKTKGTCSQMIEFEITDGKVHNVKFTGGCNGNLKGIGQLVEGMDAEEVIKRLEGTTCGFKSTSCPDQLAQALKQAL